MLRLRFPSGVNKCRENEQYVNLFKSVENKQAPNRHITHFHDEHRTAHQAAAFDATKKKQNESTTFQANQQYGQTNG